MYNILCQHDKSRDASMSFFFISETSTFIHCKCRYIYIHTWVRKAGRKEKHFLVSDTQREKEKHCTIVFFQLLKKEKKSEQHISFGSYIYDDEKCCDAEKTFALRGCLIILSTICFLYIHPHLLSSIRNTELENKIIFCLKLWKEVFYELNTIVSIHLYKMSSLYNK